MGKIIKKNKVGEATKYITRAKAIRKLQVNLKDFRRLCILKGIYPREPPKKLQKTNKTYYHTKDINYIAHERILQKYRELKSHMRKVRKAKARGELQRAKQLIQNKPVYTLHHLVKERYPTFVDALRDLDDPLCMINLFAVFPGHKDLGIPRDKVEKCIKLTREFNLYCIKSKSLRKVFLSIKGIYYQAEIEGQIITWIQPYLLPANLPIDVDYRIMLTFLEFYEVLMHFVIHKLFTKLGIAYPLEISGILENASYFSYKSFILKNQEALQSNSEVAKQEKEKYQISDKFKNDEEIQKIEEKENFKGKDLFKGMTFYLSSEVPKYSLEFVILCFGGQVIQDSDVQNKSDIMKTVTHVITDRNNLTKIEKNKEYIQPQWIYDCVNNKIILNVSEYAPGKALPPHLSPFVTEKTDLYQTERELEIKRIKGELPQLENEQNQVEDQMEEENQDEQDDSNLEEEKEVDTTKKSEKQIKQQQKEKQNSKIGNQNQNNLQKSKKANKQLQKDQEDDDDDKDDESSNEEEQLSQEDSNQDNEEEENQDEKSESSEDVSSELEPNNEQEEDEFDALKEQQKLKKQKNQEKIDQKDLAKSMMTKKNRALYNIMMKNKEKKQQEADKLKQKAALIKKNKGKGTKKINTLNE